MNRKPANENGNGFTCEVQNCKSETKSNSKSHKLYSIFHSQKSLEMQISLSLFEFSFCEQVN